MGTTFTWTCANCGREAGKLERAFEFGSNIVCGECYRRLSADAPTPTTEAVKARAIAVAVPRARAAEETFFQQGDIWVTNTRFIVASQTFAMQGVTSVRSMQLPPKLRMGEVLAVVVGFLLALGGIPACLEGLHGDAIALTAGIVLVIVGSIAAAGPLLQQRRERPTYGIVLRTADGEVTAHTSKDRDLIMGIVAGLNKAIVARG